MVGTYRRNPVTSRSRHCPLPREAQLVPAGASVAIGEGPLMIGFDWSECHPTAENGRQLGDKAIMPGVTSVVSREP